MKKLSAILLCLLMIVTCSLAGCAGFYIDKVKYYNEVLVSVGNTKITRYELLSAYNSYGSNYYSSESESSALKSTLNLLIDREAMYQYALDNGTKFKPTQYQVNSAIESMFESLDSQMETYVKNAKSILHISIDETETSTETDETAYLIDSYKYKKRANVDENGKITYITEDEPSYYEKLIDETYLEDFTNSETISAIQNAYLKRFKENLERNENENVEAIYEKALSLFAKDLINYEYYLRDEKGNAYSKVTSELISRYFKRTFDSQIKSLYLSNIRTDYLETEELDINKLLVEYRYQYDVNYQLYSNDTDAYLEKIKAIGTDGNSILYHPATDTKLGYFIHTLIKFDTLEDAVKALEKETDEEKQTKAKEEILSQVYANPRNSTTGLVDKSTKVYLDEIFDEYAEIQDETDYDKKLEKFIEFMFKYTGDEKSTLVSGMPYVIGTNGYSQMQEAFTNEAIDLMETGVVGATSNANINDVSSWCVTSYGIHFLMYVNDVNAYDLDYNNIPSDATSGKYFDDRILNPLTGKTYFDMLFDSVYPASSDEVYTSNNGFSDHEKQIVETSKKTHKVVKYKTKINSTKTSL